MIRHRTGYFNPIEYRLGNFYGKNGNGSVRNYDNEFRFYDEDHQLRKVYRLDTGVNFEDVIDRVGFFVYDSKADKDVEVFVTVYITNSMNRIFATIEKWVG